MDNLINEYLVGLGWTVDTRSENIARAALAGFDKSVTGTAGNVGKTLTVIQTGFIKSISKSLALTKTQTTLFNSGVVAAEKTTAGLVKNIFAFQVGAIGALTAVSGAFIGLADHVAQGDLELQISAQRMMLALPVARQFTNAMDALGVSFDQLAASPELQARFRSLLADSADMEKNFGSGYEDQLHKIRDIRFEFTRLRQEGNYVAMGVVSDVMKGLGLGPDEIEQKLKGLADYVRAHIPEISKAISDDLVPILKTTGVVFEDLGHMGKDAFELVQHFIGTLTGDSELKNGPVTFDSISKSILHVINAVDSLIKGIDDVEQGLLYVAKAGDALLHGNFKGAADDLKAAFSHFTPTSGGIVGGVAGAGAGAGAGTIIGGVIGSAAGPLGTVAGAAIGGPVGSFVGGAVGTAEGFIAGKVKQAFGHDAGNDKATAEGALVGSVLGPLGILPGAMAGSAVHQFLNGDNADANKKLIAQIGDSIGMATGLGPIVSELGMAVAKVESSFHQFDAHGNVLMPNDPKSHARGLFQIEPALAKDLGIDASDPTQNVAGGLSHLVELLKHYQGNVREALEGYYAGQGAEDKALRTGIDDPAALAYADKVLKGHPDLANLTTQMNAGHYADARTYQDQATAAATKTANVTQTTTVGDVNVHITQPGATPEQVHAAVKAGVTDALHQQTSDTLQQVQGVY